MLFWGGPDQTNQANQNTSVYFWVNYPFNESKDVSNVHLIHGNTEHLLYASHDMHHVL